MKKESKLVWVSWMSRFGEPSPTDAYASGVFSDIETANKEGVAESKWRGGKYVHQFCPAYVNGIVKNKLSDPSVISGTTVIVASVEHLTKKNSRCHFLGVFSSAKKARKYGRKVYPGWRVVINEIVVDEGRKPSRYEDTSNKWFSVEKDHRTDIPTVVTEKFVSDGL